MFDNISLNSFRMRNISDKNCREIKNTLFMFNTFFSSKIVPFVRKCQKYDRARGATTDIAIWRIRIKCWISKATRTQAHVQAHAPCHTSPLSLSLSLTHTHTHTHTHSGKCLILTAFVRQQWLAKSPQLYVIRTLAVLFIYGKLAASRTP
jgi:hypothetical protein